MILPLVPLLLLLLAPPDPQHDFDFEIGSWKTRLSRLVRPLTGSDTWASYEGTTVVRECVEGRANLVELEVGDRQASSRAEPAYTPESRQWSLNFSNSRARRPGARRRWAGSRMAAASSSARRPWMGPISVGS